MIARLWTGKSIGKPIVAWPVTKSRAGRSVFFDEDKVKIITGFIMAEIHYMTQEGLDKLKKDLADALAQRPVISAAIGEAREKGDLSENAEYDAAKDEQRDIEARIEELEKILKNAEVVVEEEVDLEKISIGCRVKILDLEYNEELVYKIVGSTEANSLKGKISNESPVGRALIGSKVGDVIKVETQAGELSYKVLDIDRSN